MNSHDDDWWDDWHGWYGNWDYRVGTTLDDYFDPRDTNDVISSLAGNDTIYTGNGIDFVFAGAQDDTIIAGDGINYVRGGLDHDLFQFEPGVSGITFIRDFVSGEDVLDLSSFGVESLSEIQTSSYGYGTFMFIGAYTIHINLQLSQMSAGDFIFANPVPTQQTADFEALDNPTDLIGVVPDGYAGLSWTSFGFIEYDEWSQYVTSGFMPSSGDNLAYNMAGGPASISASTDFDLESLSLSAGWNDGLEVTITGYDNGVSTGSETFTIAYGAATAVTLDDAIFDVVDEVVFTATGGVDSPLDTGSGTHFGVDDLVYFI